MKLTLLADDRVRYEVAAGPLTVEAPTAETQFSPFHMLAGSLAVCTFSVLGSWAEHAKLTIDDLVIEVAWTFAEGPHRVGAMTLEFEWPSLPPARQAAARRAAALCTVHQTLHHPPEVTIRNRGEAASGADAAVPLAPVAAADGVPRVGGTLVDVAAGDRAPASPSAPVGGAPPAPGGSAT